MHCWYFCPMCEVGVEIMSDVCCASMIMHYFEHVISIMEKHSYM